jgi:hypothetical protein
LRLDAVPGLGNWPWKLARVAAAAAAIVLPLRLVSNITATFERRGEEKLAPVWSFAPAEAKVEVWLYPRDPALSGQSRGSSPDAAGASAFGAGSLPP